MLFLSCLDRDSLIKVNSVNLKTPLLRLVLSELDSCYTSCNELVSEPIVDRGQLGRRL